MNIVPIWVWVVSLTGVAGMVVSFVATIPRDRRPDVASGLVLRVVLVAVLAAQGVFAPAPADLVPWIAPIMLIAMALSLTSLRAATVAELPALTRGQAFRAVGAVFLVLMFVGVLPPVFALPAGLGDLAVGLAAPLIARRLQRGDTRGAVWFHALGIVDLLVAVGVGFVAAPGHYQVFAGSVTTAPLTALPLVLIPTVLVPLSIAVHIVAIRMLTGARQPASVQPALQATA